uniref:Adaptor related protein complex 3 sigma 2 subunit n=1 Tax=Gallus gallus TaxID=9031 RepID=A0A8V0YVY9_CHICK
MINAILVFNNHVCSAAPTASSSTGTTPRSTSCSAWTPPRASWASWTSSRCLWRRWISALRTSASWTSSSTWTRQNPGVEMSSCDVPDGAADSGAVRRGGAGPIRPSCLLVHYILQEVVIGGMVLETNMNEIVAQAEAQSKLEKAEGGLSAAPSRAVSAVKNINLPEIPRNINIGDINIKVPNLSQFM